MYRTLLSGIVLFLVLVYMINRYTRHLTEKCYETEFLREHRETIEQIQSNDAITVPSFIPLTLERWSFENSVSLCKQYKAKYSPLYYTNQFVVERFQPRVQVQFIGFRRVDAKRRPSRPVRIEIIRCSERCALFMAGRGRYSYLLMKDSNDDSVTDTIFYIRDKFQYKKKVLGADALASESQSREPLIKSRETSASRSGRDSPTLAEIKVEYV